MSSRKIAFLCDWGESSAGLLERLVKQTPNNSGKWDDNIGLLYEFSHEVFITHITVNKIKSRVGAKMKQAVLTIHQIINHCNAVALVKKMFTHY